MRSRMLLPLLLLSGCAAFTDFADGPGPDAVWRNALPTSPLQTEVSTRQTMLAWGDTLTVTARLVNHLDAPVDVLFSNGCTSGYSLWSGDTMVYSPQRLCTMATVKHTYPPGAGPPYTVKWVWNQEAIAPGAYRFVVGLGATGEMDSGEVPIVLRAR